LKYASSAAMVTALVAVLAPSTGAMASMGVATYFGLKLVKTIIGAKIGGIVGTGAAKLYENFKGNKEEKLDQAKLDQAIENGESIERVIDLIKEIEDNKIKRENDKLKIALLGGILESFSASSITNLLDSFTNIDNISENTVLNEEESTANESISLGAKARAAIGVSNGVSKQVSSKLRAIFN
jgi:hypothetical protein